MYKYCSAMNAHDFGSSIYCANNTVLFLLDTGYGQVPVTALLYCPAVER
jgi:hypothetical protein